MESGAALFAVVDFAPAAGQRVRTVVVAFESVAAADRFAADHHLRRLHRGPGDLPRRPPLQHEKGPATPLPHATHPAPTTVGRPPLRLDVGHATTVEVDGATVADPDPHLPARQAGTRLPVVTVRLPGHLTHSLAPLLATRNALTTLMASDLPTAWDGTAYASALHHAAQATGSLDTTACPRPR